MRENPKIPTTADQAEELVLAVADALPEHASFYDRDLGATILARTPTTPAWGRDGHARLAITVELDGPNTAWALTLDRADSPTLDIAAELTAGDAPAVAALADRVNRGVHGNPFPY